MGYILSPPDGGPKRIINDVANMEDVFYFSDDWPCPENHTMFQAFEWHCPADHKHWQRLSRAILGLASLGITTMWIPPAVKASRSYSNGYDPYDLYDLGEFNQKGTRHTKWGTKAELEAMVTTANDHGIKVLFDTVLNHKAAADSAEKAMAVRVDDDSKLPLHTLHRRPGGATKLRDTRSDEGAWPTSRD
jgi:hypothetical protein